MSFSLLFFIPFFFSGWGWGGRRGVGVKNEVIISRLNINILLLNLFTFCSIVIMDVNCDYFVSFSQFHQSLDAGPDVFVCRCCMPRFEGWSPLFSSQPTAGEGDSLFNQVYLVHICYTKSASTKSL